MKRSLRLTALLMAAVMCFVPVLQVQAVAISGTAVMIGLGAAAVVSSIMIGLGVMPGSDRNAFNTIVQSCTESASVGAYIRDGLIDVLRYKNSGGGIRYGVLQNLIEAVRGWLFDNDVLAFGSPSTSCSCKVYNTSFDFSCSVPVYPLVLKYHIPTSTTPYLFVGYIFSDSQASISTRTNNGSWSSKNLKNLNNAYETYPFGYFQTFYTYNSKSSDLSSDIPVIYMGSIANKNSYDLPTSFDWHSFVGLSSSYDLSLGDVASPSDDLTSSYADWSAGSIAVPHPGIDIPGVDTPGTGEDTGEGEEGEESEEGEEADKPPLVYWPTGIIDPSTDTTDVLTQENIMAGTGTLDDTLTGEITGPIVGGITGDITLEETPAIPGEGEDVGTGEGTGEGEIVAPADKAMFMLDLREIFPFCIPFDIYKFLNILSADPVAPVFEWKIPVPQIGKEFGFEVDLSAWDNVAAVFRKLELLAFIVGLAVLTRDKFIRS